MTPKEHDEARLKIQRYARIQESLEELDREKDSLSKASLVLSKPGNRVGEIELNISGTILTMKFDSPDSKPSAEPVLIFLENLLEKRMQDLWKERDAL